MCNDVSKVFDQTVEQNAITVGESQKKPKCHSDRLMSNSEISSKECRPLEDNLNIQDRNA